MHLDLGKMMPATQPEHNDTIFGLPLQVFYWSLALVPCLFFATGIYAVDSYNHVTRLTIQCSAPGDPLLEMWQFEWAIIPNLAIDIINLATFCSVPPVALIQGVTILATIAILAAAWRFQRIVAGSNNAFILLVPAMMFNLVTFMGYTNYWIGVAITMWLAVLLWSRSNRWLRSPYGLIVLNLIGGALFFCHAFALALGGLLIGLRQLVDHQWKDLRCWIHLGLRSIAALVLPIALVMMTNGASGDGLGVSIGSKFRTLRAASNYGDLIASVIVLFLWITLMLVAFRERLVAIGKGMRIPLAVMAILLSIMPANIFDAIDVDSRTAVAITILACASIQALSDDRRLPMAVASISVATIAVHLASAWPSRAQFAADVAEVRAASANLSKYGTLLTTSVGGASGSNVPKVLHFHMGSIATKEAAIFNPFEFSGKGMQPLVATPAFDCRSVAVGMPIHDRIAEQLANPDLVANMDTETYSGLVFAGNWPRNFNYVMHLHYGSDQPEYLKSFAAVYQGTFFDIYGLGAISVMDAPCGN